MEFIFIFTEMLFAVVLIHLLKIVEIIRTFGIDALVKDEVFPVFLMFKSMSAVGAAQGELFRETVFPRGEGSGADLAGELAGGTVVAVEVRLWCIAGRAFAVLWDITFFTPGNRKDLFAVFMLEIRNEELPVPAVLVELDPGEFIRFEFLILLGVGIIKGPLSERDISADEVQ